MRLTPSGMDWAFLVFDALWAIVFLYEAWENLINGRVSLYGPGAWATWLGQRLGNESTRERMRRVAHSRSRLAWAGLYMLGLGLGGIWLIARWVREFTPTS